LQSLFLMMPKSPQLCPVQNSIRVQLKFKMADVKPEVLVPKIAERINMQFQRNSLICWAKQHGGTTSGYVSEKWRPRCNRTCSVMLLDPENIDIAVGMSLLACIIAENDIPYFLSTSGDRSAFLIYHSPGHRTVFELVR